LALQKQLYLRGLGILMTMLATPPQIDTPQPDLPTYDANDLIQGGDQALILFNNQTYRLRTTRAGKLIMTK
jgi:hemin uptake protein HemP